MWCKAKAEHALVEVKWGRVKFRAVRKRARGCMPKLKAASLRGRWSRSDRRIKASIVGALAVSPGAWTLDLEAAQGGWKEAHASEDPLPQPVVRKRQSGAPGGPGKVAGASNWEKWRKRARPGDQPLWPSGNPGSPRKATGKAKAKAKAKKARAKAM